MNKIKSVNILDYYDGFGIIIYDDGGKRMEYSFDQEDSRKKLVDLFKRLGVKEVTYEEVC